MSDQKSQNPFPHRPPTAAGDGQKLTGKGSEDGMSELDHPSHMPEGVDGVQWDRLVAARRRKWDSETKVKREPRERVMSFKSAATVEGSGTEAGRDGVIPEAETG